MFIKTLRQKKHLSQEQLAELCGLSLRTVQRVESGHRISSASLRALALEFNIEIERLEQELYALEKTTSAYKELPLWVRLYLGCGWLGANRREFQKTEMFFLAIAMLFGGLWVMNSTWAVLPMLQNSVLVFGSLLGLLGAYNISVTIRVGDKYDVWSRLESTLPKGFFGFTKSKAAE